MHKYCVIILFNVVSHYLKMNMYAFSSENVWKPFIEILDYPDLIKSYENTLKHKNTDRKRKLSATEATSTESVQKKKAYVSIFNHLFLSIINYFLLFIYNYHQNLFVHFSIVHDSKR